MKQNWDIFCRVVDNFGDIGVTWRLARQLQREFGFSIRLFVDDLASFQVLEPDIDPLAPRQSLQGITIEHWHDQRTHWTDCGDVVIEAFACGLPDSLLARMAARPTPPVWINLEYLSAEDWVEGCHGLPSRHPRFPLTQYFFFPGFTSKTGGLICEGDLIDRRNRFNCDDRQHWRNAWLQGRNDLLISLFCYENPALPAWLTTLAAGSGATVLVADGKARHAVNHAIGGAYSPGDAITTGALTLHFLPFLPQTEYDRVLWGCDINFVRGEDSCVRAQWAALPFVWHIYPTEDLAHLDKLDSLLRHLYPFMADAAFSDWQAFIHAWNIGDASQAGTAWNQMLAHQSALSDAAQNWADMLAQIGNLAGNLADFVRSKL
ncbi:elongation factor P maturation arginine rhamnosyltransferase EarP [Burkholderiaceae bacterium DAT-1]|nr:elongation factor P maturation arginine rhamnosyltransferase EarP [Burkholderiaceae bacterium DAT-1]